MFKNVLGTVRYLLGRKTKKIIGKSLIRIWIRIAVSIQVRDQCGPETLEFCQLSHLRYDDRRLTREPLSSFESLRKIFIQKTESLDNSSDPGSTSKEP
jgi:hypothetical protein